MHIRDLNKKALCILGFGREGQATLSAIEKYAPDATITVADQNEELITNNQKPITNFQVGENYLQNLDRFDIIIKSPGIPPQPEFDALGDKLTNSTQIFLDTVKDAGSTVIGVTGSKGKSTTASLIFSILKKAGKDTYLVGNIGLPALDQLEKAGAETFFVMEMSSFQLMHCTVSPQVAVVTSLFPEHLDYHKTMDAYKDAKKHIARFQTADDIIFYCDSSDGAKEIADESSGKKVSYTKDDSPVVVDDLNLIGEHNLQNIAAAFVVTKHFDIDEGVAIDAVKQFEPLPHRLQSVGMHHGIEWIDDAISTTPESAIAALDALSERVKTIMLGGQDRGSDFSELGKRIAASSVELVVLFPENAEQIRSATEEAGAAVTFFEASTMKEAVTCAKENTPPEGVVLLSTASPSYNMFKNFEEKGDAFQKEITHQ